MTRWIWLLGCKNYRILIKVIRDAAVIEDYEADFTSDSDKAKNNLENDDENKMVYGNFTESEDE